MDTNHDPVKEALELLKTDEKAVIADMLTASIDTAVHRVLGESVANVESATELTDGEKDKLGAVLTKQFKRELSVNYSVNKRLLGGFRVRIGEWKFDTTLLTQLTQMQELLTGGGHG
jgi:F0F1-type ATP synthase delta subunit